MKNVILTLLIISGTFQILNAQTAQETFEANLETLRTELANVKKTVDSEAVISGTDEFLFSCEKMEETITTVSEILKNKVAFRADNKQKISEVLKILDVKNSSPCKEKSPNCCKENRKIFSEFCKVNGLIKSEKK